MIKKLLFLLCSFFFFSSLLAQSNTYYGLADTPNESGYDFVKVNPTTGVKTIISTIPNLLFWSRAIGFNPIDQEYAFIGGHADATLHYYVIDINTGQTVSDFQIVEDVQFIEYDVATQKYYGLYFDINTSLAYFVDIDIKTGTRTNIAQLTGLDAVWEVIGINSDDGIYALRGEDIGDIRRYYRINISTGQILSDAPTQNNVTYIEYNESDGKYYGFLWDTDPNTKFVIEVNIITGNETTVASVPNVVLIGIEPISINPDDNWYIFKGADVNDPFKFFIIDCSTGNVVSSALMNEDFHGLEYFSGTSSATNDEITKSGFNIYPNPSHNIITLSSITPTIKKGTIKIVDLNGKTIFEIPLNQQNTTLNLDNYSIPSGTYIAQIIIEKAIIDSKKLFYFNQ